MPSRVAVSVTAALIRRRDAAADAWLRERARAQTAWVSSPVAVRKRRRLALWDVLLGAWTRNGTRRT